MEFNAKIDDDDINCMDLNDLSINIQAETIKKQVKKNLDPSPRIKFDKGSQKQQIRMLRDVDVDLMELFSEGQYNLGNMSQFVHLIDGLSELQASTLAETGGKGYLTSLTTNRSSSRTGGNNKYASQVNQSVTS